MRRFAPVAAGLTVAAALLLGAALPASAAPAVPADARLGAASGDAGDPAPTVSVFAQNGGLVGAAGDVAVTVVIANPGTGTVASGHVGLAVTDRPLADAAALADWQQHPRQVPQHGISAATTSALASGTTAAVATLTVKAEDLKLSGDTTAVYGLSATVTTGDGATATALPTAAGTLVAPGAHPGQVGVAVAMPITVPGRADGLIGADDLATYTASDGLLTRELEIAEANPQLTLAIDPMILASIRVLGTAAPQSAQDWLSSLDELCETTNASFPLQYGDADVAAQAHAGLTKLLQPLGFDYAMNPADHKQPLSVGEPSPGDTGPGGQNGTTPTPSPSASEGSPVPSTEQLLDWPYSLSGIAWPTPGTVRGSDIPVFAQNGMPTTILSAGNTNAATLDATTDAALPVTGGTALVSSDVLSSAVEAAAAASDGLTAGAADAALTAQLALAADGAGAGSVVLLGLDRSWPSDSIAAADAIGHALHSPFSHPASLRDALNAPPTKGLAVVDAKPSATVTAGVAQLADREGDARSGATTPTLTISTFSSVLQTPTLLTQPNRNRFLTLLAVDWDGQPDDWTKALAAELKATGDQLNGVQISSPGTIRQYSNQALIPITVSNTLAHPIEVVLRATPSSARLEIDSDTDKVIAAGSSAKVLIPVKAQLGNGEVWLGMQLYSTSGVAIGSATGASVEVHADWEGIGASVLGVFVVAFFGFGLFRSIRRRRREKRAREAASDQDTDAAGAAGPKAVDRGR